MSACPQTRNLTDDCFFNLGDFIAGLAWKIAQYPLYLDQLAPQTCKLYEK